MRKSRLEFIISTYHGERVGLPTLTTYNDLKGNASGIRTHSTLNTISPGSTLIDAYIQLIADGVNQEATKN